MNRGLFITFEGPDRVGKSTQVYSLTKHIKALDKYQDVLETHEPWKSKEIKRRLEQDRDAYSGGLEMAELYIEDRAKHTQKLIRPNLRTEAIVISDRYKMSTCAYQWAQGVKLQELLEMHEYRGILIPDLTFCFDAPIEVLIERGVKRQVEEGKAETGVVEKFEKDNLFANKVLEAYRCLSHMAQVDQTTFGKVVVIDATKSIGDISRDISSHFDVLYSSWKDGTYQFPERRFI